MKTLYSAVLLCGALCAPFVTSAEDSQKLEPVFVTATRTPTALDQTIGTARVITREDIERLQPRDVADLLRTQPGLAVAQSGGRGKQTSVFIRGSEARNLLVLINGRRAGTVELPNFSWENLPIGDIERIEIVPGARSSLYGSQAFGGVINLITRRDAQPELRAGGGNLGSHDLSARGGLRSDAGEIVFSAGRERTAGYDASSPTNPNGNADRDGFDSKRFGVHLGANLTQALRLDVDSLHANGRNEFDGFFQSANDFRLGQDRIGLEARLAERTRLLIDLGNNRDRRQNDDNSSTDSRRRSASLQLTQDTAAGSSYTGGFDFARDLYHSEDGFGGFSDSQRLSRALFASALQRLGAFSLELGARHERDEAYSDITTGQLGLRWQFAKAASVFARGGTAFRAPTFEERFGGAFNLPNPALLPERGRTIEFGTTLAAGGVNGTLSLYRNDVSQLINANFAAFPGIYENIPGARMTGAELQLQTRLLDIDLGAGLSYLDARNTNTNLTLLRRPHKSGHLSADRRFGAFGFGATLYAQGNHADIDGTFSRSMVGGYALLDLRANWAQTPTLSWELSAHNVLDRDYNNVDTFRGAPASLRAGVTWRPGQK